MAIYSGFSHEKLWFSIVMLVYQRVTVEQCRTHLCSFAVVLACTCLFRAYDCIIMYHDWKKEVSSYAKATCGTVMNECRQCTIMGNPCFVLVKGNDFLERNSPSRSLLHQFMIQLLFLFSGFLGYLKSPPWSSWKTKVREEIMFLCSFVPYSMVYTMFKHNPKSWGVLQSSFNSDFTQKHPAGPETVPIKRTFKKKWWFYHSAVLIWWLEILEKLGARFLAFQRHRCDACAVSILVNASPLPSSSIHHQEVTFGTQAAGNWLFHQVPQNM